MEDKAKEASDNQSLNAPGAPGDKPYWSPGAKSSVGTAINSNSSVWFSTGHGIVNEVYYPRNDIPAIADMGFIVTDGNNFYSEEKIDCHSTVKWIEEGVPCFQLINISHDGVYEVRKEILTDPNHSSLIVNNLFIDNGLRENKLRLFVFLRPHLGNMGYSNNAWIETRDNKSVLMASREDNALALVCSANILCSSAGYVGVSDGCQDLSQHKRLAWQYLSAKNGNVALTAEIDVSDNKQFKIVLGFGLDNDEAFNNANDTLNSEYQDIKDCYIKEWKDWHDAKSLLNSAFAINSQTVLKVHESKNPGGGIIAGLASPWGYMRSDDDPIGYHIVWTRDMVEAAGGLLAAGKYDSIRNIIGYLAATQQMDGHWPQNMWLDGVPFWNGIQMDETALPILLINLAWKEGAINDTDVIDYWPMAKKAAAYIVRNGPVTQQDRWEEDPGYTPFTLSSEIAALLAAADFAEMNKETPIADYLKQTADNWHDAIDRWMYCSDSQWTKEYEVNGYYERIAIIDRSVVSRFQNTVHIKNVSNDSSLINAAHLVSPDALALVRFGLREADDPRIINTLKLIDKMIKIETPNGTTWHRYNDDGYGEHQDGSAFDGTGIGRGWPLLSGERGHYELLTGNVSQAKQLLIDLERFASPSGLIPEQVWDSASVKKYELDLGKPSGSAMPLAWAHAEYLKLARSIKDGKVFDLPPQTVKRYLIDKTVSKYRSWRFNHKIKTVNKGMILRIESLASASIRYSDDGWKSYKEVITQNSGLGVYYSDIETLNMIKGTNLEFTFFWEASGHWEDTNYYVIID